MLHRLLLFIVALSTISLLSLTARAQGVTSLGTDFWIAFMPNYTRPADNIRITFTSPTAATVHMEAYGGSATPADSKTFQLTANSTQVYRSTSTNQLETRAPETPAYRAIHIYSDNPIIVSGLSHILNSTDSYLAIPTAALSNYYISACFFDDTYQATADALAGEFAIVAPFDSTVVTIHNVKANTRSDSIGTLSHRKGETWSVTLMKGQTYLVQSTGKHVGEDDLTGTEIRSSKPIGLLSGHQRVGIPVNGSGLSKNHMIEMLPPVDTWGTAYYDLPMYGRILCGDLIRLIAGDTATQVAVVGPMPLLNYPGDFSDQEKVMEATSYTSSGKKFLAVMHSYSQGAYGDNAPGDPFSIVLPAKEHFVKRMMLQSPPTVTGDPVYQNYATFICQSDYLDSIRINGKSIHAYPFEGSATFSSSNPRMSGMRILLPSNTQPYTASNMVPFGAYLYGTSSADGYGQPAFSSYDVTSTDTVPPVQAITDSGVRYRTIAVADIGSGIATVELINDSLDWRYNKGSQNVTLVRATDLIPGSHNYSVTIEMRDSTKPAVAELYGVDRAGNDTVIEYRFDARPIVVLDTFCPEVSIDRFDSVAYALTVSDPISGLRDVSLVSESGSCGTTASSFNVELIASPLSFGAHTYTLSLQMTDTTKPAFAALCTTDTAGNACSHEFSFAARAVHSDVSLIENEAATFELTVDPLEHIVTLSVAGHRGADGEISICDILGREVRRERLSGAQTHTIDLGSLSAGTYFVSLRTGESVTTRRVVLK